VDEALMRERAAAARVARLATVRADGKPHVVPCCFALDGDLLYSAVDDVKPKSTAGLRRLDNIRAQPAVTVLVDHYSEVWTELWWIRLDGKAQVAEPGAPGNDAGLELLQAKYDQYRRQPPTGPLITVEILAWRAWP
jgi:PPOX class probable F420-dependent enzyme